MHYEPRKRATGSRRVGLKLPLPPVVRDADLIPLMTPDPSDKSPGYFQSSAVRTKRLSVLECAWSFGITGAGRRLRFAAVRVA